MSETLVYLRAAAVAAALAALCVAPAFADGREEAARRAAAGLTPPPARLADLAVLAGLAWVFVARPLRARRSAAVGRGARAS